MTSPTGGRLHAIQISPGGVPKLPVPEARIEVLGVVGDAQRDRKHHGGADRAVCLWSLEVIDGLRAEGHPIAPGCAGENLTLAGIDWPRLTPGMGLVIGDEVTLELVSYTIPCKWIRPYFVAGDIMRISEDEHPGSSRMYARVVRAGTVRAGDRVEVTRPRSRRA